MKKSKLMMGILVASMGLLGTGYAAFTQQVTLKGSAEAGEFILETSSTDGDVLANYDKKMSLNRNDYVQYVPKDKNGIGDMKFIKFDDKLDVDKGSVSKTVDNYTFDVHRLVPGETVLIPVSVKNEGDVAGYLKNITYKVTAEQNEEEDNAIIDNIHVAVQYVANKPGNVQEVQYEFSNGELKQAMTKQILPGGTGELRFFIGLDEKAGNACEEGDAKIDFTTTFEQYIPGTSDKGGNDQDGTR